MFAQDLVYDSGEITPAYEVANRFNIDSILDADDGLCTPVKDSFG